MFFRIEKSGCCERKGLVRIRYDLYLEKDQPICIHMVYFHPEVSDEEILYVGELALDMAYKNINNLSNNHNLPFMFDPSLKEKSVERVNQIQLTDFTTINPIYRIAK